MHVQRKQMGSKGLHSSIDKGPYVNVREDGMLMAANEETDEQADDADQSVDQITPSADALDPKNLSGSSGRGVEAYEEPFHETAPCSEPKSGSSCDIKNDLNNIAAPLKKCMLQLSKQSRRSMWLLAYVAIVTSWPFLSSALFSVFKKKPAWLRR